ncbi:hypothetical protein B5S25_18540 [Paenibacillus larvae subsp. pulvifaciens]|nr:hypothetical protein B5S25_18540 [Paenibacillus larvae subsp. pulvifaciens]MBH0343767.1 hypothetical protein [Paenibacillus larvae]
MVAANNFNRVNDRNRYRVVTVFAYFQRRTENRRYFTMMGMVIMVAVRHAYQLLFGLCTVYREGESGDCTFVL